MIAIFAEPKNKGNFGRNEPYLFSNNAVFMKFLCRFLFLSVCVSFLSVLIVQAQDRIDRKSHPDFFQKVDRAYQQGDITLDQKVLFKFFPSEAKGKLAKDMGIDLEHPLKCGTPAVADYQQFKSKLSAATVNRIRSVLSKKTIQASETYQSPDGHFTIHYETTGSHAVPLEDANADGVPDYVEEVAAAADSSYRHQVQQLGYTDPIAPDESYDVEIRNLDFIYGQTYTTSGSTAIQIENDFSEDFPPNDDPEGNQIGAIKVTMAHEFKHAIQFAANEWVGETRYWLEMDATLMEEVVYDNVNDYYHYLQSDQAIFSNPELSFYPGSYFHVSWALYFEEKYGSQFWVDVWQTIKDNTNITMINAMSQQLGGFEAFNRDYVESQLWHYASGDNSTSEFGFEESAHYPTPAISRSFVGDDSLAAPDTLDKLSASYTDIQSSPFPGTISINISDLSVPAAGLGVLAYFRDGRVEPLTIFNEQQEIIRYDTNWQWENIEKLGLVTTNGSPQQPTKYGLAIRSIEPQMMRVEQNYPNPFRKQTTIRYSIPEQKHVTLEVFDILGRKVATLVNKSQPEGIYPKLFEAENLASGIYFYRLIIDGKVTTKKMTLVK